MRVRGFSNSTYPKLVYTLKSEVICPNVNSVIENNFLTKIESHMFRVLECLLLCLILSRLHGKLVNFVEADYYQCK